MQRLLLQTVLLQLALRGFRCSAARVLEEGPKMKPRKLFTRMSTGVVVLGMALCVPAAMLAQDTAPQGTTDQQSSPGEQPMHHHQPPSPERQLQQMTKMLNLTSDQQQQMLPILQDQQKQMATIRSNSALSPQDRRQQMRSAMMDSRQKQEAIMTDSQKQQFEQAMQQRRSHMQNRGAGQGEGAGTPPPADQNAPPPQQ